MVSDEHIEASRAVQRRTGKTFHVATRFLPERVRYPTYVLYAFFRTADDVVDVADPDPPPVVRDRLAAIRAAALGERPTDDPVLAAFADLRAREDIDDREVDVFMDAMAADVEPTPYETEADLASYLRGSAVAVAYMMLDVMDVDDESTARPHAKALGEAFQLTNFLRDVREDVTEYDRVYLPRSTLARHDVTVEDVRSLRWSPGFAAAMRTELRRTERRYRTGVAGIRHLPADCQFPVLLAAVFYAEYHRLIRERGYNVLADPPALGYATYARLLLQTAWHWRRERDPETVFYRVSAIASDPSAADPPGAGTASSEPLATGSDPDASTLSGPVGRLTDRVRSRWSFERPEWR